MIGISADFDPVHKGHEELIKQGKKIANEKETELWQQLRKQQHVKRKENV